MNVKLESSFSRKMAKDKQRRRLINNNINHYILKDFLVNSLFLILISENMKLVFRGR